MMEFVCEKSTENPAARYSTGGRYVTAIHGSQLVRYSESVILGPVTTSVILSSAECELHEVGVLQSAF